MYRILFSVLLLASPTVAAVIERRQAIANITSAANLSPDATASTPIISIDGYPNGTLEATAWAIIYTYPFAIYANVIGGILKNVGVNQLANQLYLASPDETGVIKPNTDVLYSRVALDLSESDLVLTVPNISDGRYYVFPFYDVYGNVIAELGIVNANPPGQYLVRRSIDVDAPLGLLNASYTGNGTDFTASSAYQGIINFPSSYGTMLIRLAVLTNSSEEIQTLHGYQNATTLTAVPREDITQIAVDPAPSLQSLSNNGSFLGIASPAAQLAFASKLLPWSQSEIYSDRYRVASILATAGLYNGSYTPATGVNLTEAAIIANSSISANINAPANVREQGNNWILSVPGYQGNFSTNYGSAAYVALFGYQQQSVFQTLYPGYESLGYTSTFTLQPNTSILLTFSGKPPVSSPGFWSLSVYGVNQQLVPNSLYRFKAGSINSNLTYSDGSYVYGNNASSQDGPFQVLIQLNTSEPPANWTNNWIPATSTFTWLLRWYIPTPSITDGGYTYPLVQVITEILPSASSSNNTQL